MKILVLDNYDSFTYNLVHYIESITKSSVDVYLNDRITLEEIRRYDKIVLSPGPGIPKEAGILLDLIRTYAPSKSMLGVCLGHQAIAEAFGGKLFNSEKVYHGIATPVRVLMPDKLFRNIPEQFLAGRYHSWVVDKESLPDELEIICTDNEQNIMAIRHKKYDIRGVQFHPESILTEFGYQLIQNWLSL